MSKKQLVTTVHAAVEVLNAALAKAGRAQLLVEIHLTAAGTFDKKVKRKTGYDEYSYIEQTGAAKVHLTRVTELMTLPGQEDE